MKCTNYCFKPLGLLFLLCLIPLWAFSQNITVKGVVKDATGESVIGASVVQKGTSNGIITDIDGNLYTECSIQQYHRNFICGLQDTRNSCSREDTNQCHDEGRH